jgi:hypothetical protein
LYYYDLFIDQHEFPLNYEHYPEWHVKQHWWMQHIPELQEFPVDSCRKLKCPFSCAVILFVSGVDA